MLGKAFFVGIPYSQMLKWDLRKKDEGPGTCTLAITLTLWLDLTFGSLHCSIIPQLRLVYL